MKKFYFSLICLALTAMFTSLFSPAEAQYRQTYRPDTSSLKNISLFDATGIVETGIPGSEIAIAGSLTGNDSSSAIRQTVFLFQTSYLGEPKDFRLFRDTSPLLFYGPRAYALTYDGHDNFYIALGSNDKQLLLSMSKSGTFRYVRNGNHHDYYSVVMDGEEVVFLGQDESTIGLHDFSLAKMDSNGNPIGNGNMFGTVEFDLPQKMISTPEGYIMCGFTFLQGAFNATVIKADKSLNLGWSQIYGGISKDVNCNDIAAAPDGSGYVAVGRIQDLNNGVDSLLAFKLDTAGNLLWSYVYGIDSAKDMEAYAIAADPNGGGYVIAGSYRIAPAFDQPYVMKIDGLGDPQWIRTQGKRNDSIQELIKDIIVAQGGSFYYAVGEETELNAMNQVTKAMFVVKAGLSTGEIPCDSAMSLGKGTAILIPSGTSHEEPFLANSAYNFFADFGGQMNSVVNCSVIVATVPRITDAGNDFAFVNPAGNELQLQYMVNQGTGTLALNDLQGRILRQFPMQEGYHRETYRLDELPQGIYLLTAHGEGWRSQTKRLLIVR